MYMVGLSALFDLPVIICGMTLVITCGLGAPGKHPWQLVRVPRNQERSSNLRIWGKIRSLCKNAMIHDSQAATSRTPDIAVDVITPDLSLRLSFTSTNPNVNNSTTSSPLPMEPLDTKLTILDEIFG